MPTTDEIQLDVTPDITIDAVGFLCPVPISKASKAIRGLNVGAIVELLADDEQVLEDPVDQRPSVVREREAKDILENALTKIEPLLRSIFLLKESHGLSYREIAEAADIPEGTVASRLNRARRHLKDHLIELGWEQ